MMATKGMTVKERDMMRFIRTYQRQNDMSPTMRELCAAMGVASVSTMNRRLQIMQKKGFLTTRPGVSRSIRLADVGPLLDGGSGSESEEVIPISPDAPDAMDRLWDKIDKALGEPGVARIELHITRVKNPK